MDLSSLSDEELLNLYNNGGKQASKSADANLSKMSDAQLLAMYSRINPPKPAETVEEKKPEEPGMFGRFGRGVSRQTEGLLSSLETAYDTTLGGKTDEEAYRASEERQKKIAEKYPGGPSLDKLTEAYNKKGIVGAAGEALYQVPEAVGSIVPTMAGGIVGGLIGGPAGAAVGMGATSGLTQYGSNLERQFEEQAKSGRPIDADRGAAAIGAVAQAGLDTVGFMIPFGKAILSPFYKIAEKGGIAAAEKLAAESITKTLSKGTAVGMLAEIPTEVAQQMIERYQAGMPLFTEDAYKEYGDIAYQTAISVAPLGGPGRMIEKSGARAEVAKAQADEEEKKRLAAEETQYVGQRQQQFTQADQARQELEKAQSEEAAKAAGMGYQPKLEAPPERAEGPAPAPEERTYPELRGDNFVIVGEKSGNPVQGGFRTMEEAKAASDAYNQNIKEQEDAAAIEAKKVKDAKFVELANKIRNAGGTPIYLDEVPTGIAAKIHNARLARAGQPYILDQSAPFTTAQEINALELNEDRNLTVVKRGRDGRILLRSGGPKPDEMNLSDRLLQVQNPGIDVANGLTIPGEQAQGQAAQPTEQGKPVVMQGQRDNLAQQSRDEEIAKEKAAKDWENSPVKPFSDAVQKQQDRVNKLTEAIDNTTNKADKAALQKRLAKAQGQLEDAQNKLNEAQQKYGVAEGPYRPAEVIGQQKAEQQSKMKAALKTAFDKMGLTKQGISPEVVSYLADAEGKPQRGASAVEAEYSPHGKTITFASDIYDPNLSVDEIVDKMMDVLNHEIIHSLKAAGLFTKPEWNILENFVKNGEGKRFLERAKVVYPDLSPSEQIEEAVAEAARAFKDGDFKPVGKPRSLFERIVNFFKSIFSTAKNNNTTPEAIFDAIRKGEIGNRKATQDATQAKTMQSKVGDNGGPPLEEEKKNWINVPRLLQFLGSQMYKNNISQVASKELVQNAFDSVKSAQAQGTLVGPGKITYRDNKEENSMTITDNGIGMDEEVLKKAFFTIFGSEKKGLDPKERSGGFGLAKLAYLLASDDIKIETTKDGVTYRVHTSGAKIKAMYEEGTDIDIKKESTPNKPNGSSVTVKIPKESIDKMNGTKIDNSVGYPDVLSKYSGRKFIGNAKFYEYNKYSDKFEEIKQLTDLSEFGNPITKKFTWGEVDLYLGKKLEKDNQRPQVLSAGVFQFSRPLYNLNYDSPKVKAIYNVKPYNTPAPIDLEEYFEEGKKEGTSNIYPFNPDRESFKEFVNKDIAKLDAMVWAEHNDLSLAKEVRAMSSFYIMEKGGEQEKTGFNFKKFSAPAGAKQGGVSFKKVDIGLTDIDIENKNFTGDKSRFPSNKPYFHNNLNVDIIEEAGVDPKIARDFFYDIGKVMHDFAFVKLDEVANIYDKYEAYGNDEDKRIAGVSLDKGYAGANTKFPMVGMFINPFYMDFFKDRKIKLTPAGVAAYWFRIMKHEAAHEIARSHDNKFAIEEVMLDTMLDQVDAETNGETTADLRKRLEEIYKKYRPTYEAMRDVYERPDTKNNSESIGGDQISKLEGEDSGQASRAGNEYGPRREGSAVGPRVKEGREGGVYFPKGMSVEAEGITNGGGVRKENGPVKQSRVGPSYKIEQAPVNVSLNTPQEKAESVDINKELIKNHIHLAKLTKDEGTRTSQTYMDYIKEFINPYHMLGKGADKFRIARALTVGTISDLTRKINDYVKIIADAKTDSNAIYKYLTTRDASPDQIKNAAARKAAPEIKKLINDIGDELVRRDLLGKKDRARFVDNYLPRVYLAYIDQKKHVRGGMKPSHQYYLETRYDLTKEQRERLGEIDDPAFLVQEALFAPMRDIAILNFFDKVNEIGNGQWIIGMDQIKYKNPSGHTYKKSLPELKMFRHRLERMVADGHTDPDKLRTITDELANLTAFINKTESDLDANVDQGRYIKVPKDMNRFGPLAGVWLARPIYRDIMGMGSFIPNNMSEVAALFSDGGMMASWNRHFKVAKVAMNPPTIVTNIISNTLMMHFADVAMHRILPNIASVFKEIVMDKKGKYYDLVHKYGLKETTLSEAELHRLYDELRKRQTGGSDLNKVMSMFNALGRVYGKAEDKASNFYGSIETVFKAAIIKDAMEKQINKATGKHFTEEEAVLKANKYLFDYSEVHDSVKALRNVPFGAPFLTWSYKMVPLLIETALTKPLKFAPYAMLMAGVSAYAAAQMGDAGGSDEDKEKLRKYLNRKVADNPFVLVANPTDAFDFGKYMPFNNLYKFGDAMTKGDFVEALKAFGFFGGPIADLGVAVLTGKDPFTKQDIFPKGSTYDEKAVLTFNYIYNTFSPSFMKDMPRFVAGHGVSDTELLQGAESPTVNLLKEIFEDPKGKKPGMPTKSYGEIAANILGFNIYHPSFAQYAKNLNSFNFEMNEIKSGYRTAMQDPTLSAKDKENLTRKYTGLIKEKQQEIQKFFKDTNLSPAVAKIVAESIEGTKR